MLTHRPGMTAERVRRRTDGNEKQFRIAAAARFWIASLTLAMTDGAVRDGLTDVLTGDPLR
jgi:hypothetical protein